MNKSYSYYDRIYFIILSLIPKIIWKRISFVIPSGPIDYANVLHGVNIVSSLIVPKKHLTGTN